jgi:ATP-dependent DNA helicase RecQ
MKQELKKILNERFDLPEFRPGQCEAIEALLNEKSLLCIQPTGHGKSLLYQLPAVILPGITIVISPLLALMRDQVQQLNSRFSIASASINSDQDDAENNVVKQKACDGKLKILFVSPEQLDRLDVVGFLLSLPISLLVIDEAHCISTWGHDFRPSYRQILPFVEQAKQNNRLHLLALTATANQKTEDDIKVQVSGKGVITTHRHSMARNNIALSVIATQGLAEKLLAVKQLLQQQTGAGLIYCATRENTEIVADYLQTQGIAAAAYHAGFSAEKKRTMQQAFIDNQYEVITATNALGMGIDKQDLRYIIHFDIPGSITAYYQEVGRSGRDGKEARGIILFDFVDIKIQTYFIDSAQPSLTDFQIVLSILEDAEDGLMLTEIKRESGLHPTRLTVVLAELIEQQFVKKLLSNGRQRYYLMHLQQKPNLERYQRQRAIREQELDDMINYAEQQKNCLMSLLRLALGDRQVELCGKCMICLQNGPTLQYSQTEIKEVNDWLAVRTQQIDLGKLSKALAGISVLDGSLRSASFIDFMKHRTQTEYDASPDLLRLLKTSLDTINSEQTIVGVIPLPSNTWASRDRYASWIARVLNLPLFDVLSWQTMPEARQGELLNNDQRKFNVNKKMVAKAKSIPSGVILLLDDYIGSGATMKEAARALRSTISNTVLPFTIAKIRWRLGKRGFV